MLYSITTQPVHYGDDFIRIYQLSDITLTYYSRHLISGDSRNEDRWVRGSYFLCYVFTVYVVNVRELTIALGLPTYNRITSYLQERRGVLAHPQPHRRIASA